MGNSESRRGGLIGHHDCGCRRAYEWQYQVKRMSTRWAATKPRTTSSSNFTVKGILGHGGFGFVYLVIEKDSGDIFAMKKVKIDNDSIDCPDRPFTERDVLNFCQCDFIVGLYSTCAEPGYLIYIMEYLPCGDLYKKTHLDESSLMFLSSQMFIAIDYLHSNFIVHRDIKPLNVFLGANGYLKVGDLGLALDSTKKYSGRFYTVCGTAGFMAPEVKHPCGYTKGCDWYSYGAVIFFLKSGYSPFDTCALPRGLPFSPEDWTDVTDPCKNFVHSLLLSADCRLGCLRNGSADIKNHEWFSQIDWDCLKEQRYLSPMSLTPAPVRPLSEAPREDSYLRPVPRIFEDF